MILNEITIEIRNLCVKILFDRPPTIGRICECIGDIFTQHPNVERGIIALLLSVGDDKDRRELVLKIGDRIDFSEDDKPIGYMDMQSRTLFYV